MAAKKDAVSFDEIIQTGEFCASGLVTHSLTLGKGDNEQRSRGLQKRYLDGVVRTVL